MSVSELIDVLGSLAFLVLAAVMFVDWLDHRS